MADQLLKRLWTLIGAAVTLGGFISLLTSEVVKTWVKEHSYWVFTALIVSVASAFIALEQTYDVDEIITRMPTPEEAQRLGLGTGQPVAEHTRVGYTADGKAVRAMISIVPGDTLILRYVVPT